MDIAKKLKIFFGILSAIILGAIGSGVWEQILGPILNFLVSIIIKILGKLSINLQDRIYNKASSGFHEIPSLIMLLLLTMFFLLLSQRYLYNNPNYKKIKIENIILNFLDSKYGFYLKSFLIIAGASFLAFGGIIISSANDVTTFSEKSIRIVAPYIEEKEKLMLVSEFSQIKTTNDFNQFKIHLEKIAKNNNLELPKFISPSFP